MQSTMQKWNLPHTALKFILLKSMIMGIDFIVKTNDGGV